MKKLLLATSILAFSSTAMAANTSDTLDGKESDTLSVIAHYVTPISVALDTTTIDFGDVFTDSEISTEAVVATVVGEADETFTYSVTSDGDLALLTGDTTGSTVTFGDTGTSKALTFNVGLDTGKVTDADVSEVITIAVNYDAIADTTVTKA
ncbi:hypothetical protein H4J46_11340 [Colwellia sp. MB02u-6]|uniref:hypothetical protein n=1 Tax=Colwellia sp. MB02u-6 TaxID=2759824 RepID=UPI0015F70B55|nr:hypothetical protein [Colwellia sp. MB02u-6]MBA6328529.1 hypothetical protein [Colwellia sp. MB02u-6]